MAPCYEVSVRTHFSAAHHLREYPGPCAEPHGHNWEVEVTVRGSEVDASGLLVDFRVVKEAVAEALRDVDHRDLNRVAAFVGVNPTSENIARYLFDRLSTRINVPRYRVARVTVGETPGSRASYGEA